MFIFIAGNCSFLHHFQVRHNRTFTDDNSLRDVIFAKMARRSSAWVVRFRGVRLKQKRANRMCLAHNTGVAYQHIIVVLHFVKRIIFSIKVFNFHFALHFISSIVSLRYV